MAATAAAPCWTPWRRTGTASRQPSRQPQTRDKTRKPKKINGLGLKINGLGNTMVSQRPPSFFFFFFLTAARTPTGGARRLSAKFDIISLTILVMLCGFAGVDDNKLNHRLAWYTNRTRRWRSSWRGDRAVYVCACAVRVSPDERWLLCVTRALPTDTAITAFPNEMAQLCRPGSRLERRTPLRSRFTVAAGNRTTRTSEKPN